MRKAKGWLQKRAGLNLEEVPVYRPTSLEFEEPLLYIASIREEAEKFGLCRIVPPKGWDPPFALHREDFVFKTKVQAIHQLQERPAGCDPETFKLEYNHFLQSKGVAPGNWPIFEGEHLDLCKLFTCVKRRGGFSRVSTENRWGEVLRMVNPRRLSQLPATAPAKLRELYQKHLHTYEEQVASVSRPAAASVVVDVPKQGGMMKGSVKRQLPRFTPASADPSLLVKNSVAPKDESGLEIPAAKRVKIEPGATAPVSEAPLDQKCELCQGGAHEDLMILCDRCDKGYHLYCLSPPLTHIPDGNWYCLDCVNSGGESFGFGPGQEHSLSSFHRMAERFKKSWFGHDGNVEMGELELEFWQIVEQSSKPAEVLYGSDLDTAIYGSGFPRLQDPCPPGVSKEVWQKYASSPWNLNNLPKYEGSVLKHINDDIPGVIVPWLYIGMIFSSFCWHYEDHCLYSINYLHWGEPKCWYGVPGSAADSFEEVMRKMFPDLFEAQPDLLFQLVTMLNPAVLQDNGVPVYKTVQEAGEFVITFPRSYHGGFNHGLNCAEAVNFAPPDWLPWGSLGVERYRLFRKAAILSHEELLCVVSRNDLDMETARWTYQEMIRVVAREREQREQLWVEGIARSKRMSPRSDILHIGKEEDPQCVICKYYLHLSAVSCSCRPDSLACIQGDNSDCIQQIALEHGKQLCECGPAEKQLLYRHTLAELDDLLTLLQERWPSQKDNTRTGNRRRRKAGISGCDGKFQRPVSKKVKERWMSLAEVASGWLSKAKTMMRTSPALDAVTELLQRAEEFMWAGHEMDDARKMIDQLTEAKDWAKEVAVCSAQVKGGVPSTKHRVSLEKLLSLVAADPLPCVESNLPTLKAVIENARRVQSRIEEALEAKPPLELKALNALLQETQKLPLEIPEARKLKEIISSVQSWADKVRRVLPMNNALRIRGQSDLVDLPYLLYLNKEGQAFPVKTIELPAVEAAVSRCQQLQKRAKQLLDSQPSIEIVEGLLKEAEGLAAHLAEVDQLQARVAKARAWAEKMRSAMMPAPPSVEHSVRARFVKEVAVEGSRLEILMPEVALGHLEGKRFTWMDVASRALATQASTKVLSDLLGDAEPLKFPPGNRVFSRFRQVASEAISWEARASKALQEGAPLEEFSELSRLASTITARVSCLKALNAAVSKSQEWRERARPYLRSTASSSKASGCKKIVTLDELKSLSSEAATLAVKLNEMDEIKKRVEAGEKWRQTARDALQIAGLQPADRSSEAVMAEERRISSLKEIKESGLALELELPELELVETAIHCAEWGVRACRLLLRRAPMEEVEKVVEEMTGAGEASHEWIRGLQDAVDQGHEWAHRVVAVLRLNGMSYGKCEESVLADLVTEASELSVTLPREQASLEQVLSNHRTWQRLVRRAMNPDRSSLCTLVELESLQHGGEASIVRSAEGRTLDCTVAEVNAWQLRCLRGIAKRTAGSEQPLKELLLRMQRSVHIGIYQVNKQASSASQQYMCACQQPLEDPATGPPMVHCEGCNDWYHIHCLGVSAVSEKSGEEYRCPFCVAISTGTLPLDDSVYSKLYATKRPTLSSLQELLEAASSILCRMEEAELLQKVVDAVGVWQSRVSPLVRTGLCQKSPAEALNPQLLLPALKAARSLEVMEPVGAKVIAAVSARAWRQRVLHLMDGPVKPSLRMIWRAVKEGASYQVKEDDFVLSRIQELDNKASKWLGEAKKCLGEKASTPVEEVKSLVKEGEVMPVAFEKEIVGLLERCVLYCICRRPYDPERAMIACDDCGEWYHFVCVNMAEPEGSDSDNEGLPGEVRERVVKDGEFQCPKCSAGAKALAPDPASTSAGRRGRRKQAQVGLDRIPAEKKGSVAVPDDEGDVITAVGAGDEVPTSEEEAGLVVEGVEVNGAQWKEGEVAVKKPRSRGKHVLSEQESRRSCRSTAGQNSRYNNFFVLR